MPTRRTCSTTLRSPRPRLLDADALALPRLVAEHLSDLPAFARTFFRELFTHLPSGVVVVLDNYQEVPATASAARDRSGRGGGGADRQLDRGHQPRRDPRLASRGWRAPGRCLRFGGTRSSSRWRRHAPFPRPGMFAMTGWCRRCISNPKGGRPGSR